MPTARDPATSARSERGAEPREQLERRVVCSLVALPFPVPPALAVGVVGLVRRADSIVLCFEDRASGEPIDVIVSARVDDAPAYLRTDYLNLGYGATELSDRAESLVKRAASRLAALRFEQLERALEDRGIAIELQPHGPGPRWARGPSDGSVRRDPSAQPRGHSPVDSLESGLERFGEGDDVEPRADVGAGRSGGLGTIDAGGDTVDHGGTPPVDERGSAPRREGDARESGIRAGGDARESGASSGADTPGAEPAPPRRHRDERDRRLNPASRQRPSRTPRPEPDRSDPDIDSHDGLHETWDHPDRWLMFFADSELRRGRDVIIQCSLPWIHIEHGDMECRFVGIGDFVSYPWRSPWERGSHTPHARRPDRDGSEPRDVAPEAQGPQPQSMGLFTDMVDLDVIDGGRDKLVDLFELVRELPAVELVSVNCTCVPQIIGDDVGPIVRAERERCSFPILYRDQTSSTYGHHIDTMVRLLGESAAPGADPHAVNLVGFREGRGLDELRNWLRRAGARVHVSLIPELRPDLIRRYREAAVQVICPNRDWDGMVQHLVGGLELTTLRPEPPHGVARSLGWLDAVMAAVGVQDWSALRAELEQVVAGRWEPLVRRARGVGVGLVVDRGRMPMLLDAARFYSLPLLGVLVEMGPTIHLAVQGVERDVERVSAQLEVAGMDSGRFQLSAFSSPSELGAWLTQPEVHLVYSDYGYDHRITSAGKTPLSSQLFEMGVEGAIRSLERLLTLAELPLYRRLGPLLARTESPW